MQTYEIFLTNKCTRNCTFCDIIKGEYVATQDDIQYFIDYIKQNEHKHSQFSVSFFGGEPLFCYDSICKICYELRDYHNCSFGLTTNGDLIGKVNVNALPENFAISISAYDIFNDVNKYISIKDQLNRFVSSFRFTFDESTIRNIDTFKDICRKNDLPYKVVFSHSQRSWKNISISTLQNILQNFYFDELKSFYQSTDFIPSQSIFQYFNRFVQLLFNASMHEVFCITEPKISFYKGNAIGPCIRLHNAKQQFDCPRRCLKCKYKICCTKGCIAEYSYDDIDEKLCLINKIAFEKIEELFDAHKDEYRLAQILCYAKKTYAA